MEAAARPLVHDTQHEWQLRPHDGQVGVEPRGQRSDSLHVLEIHGQALSIPRDAAVARRAPHLLYASALPQLPEQGVLAAAPAKKKYFHSVGTIVGARPRVNPPAASDNWRVQFGT